MPLVTISNYDRSDKISDTPRGNLIHFESDRHFISEERRYSHVEIGPHEDAGYPAFSGSFRRQLEDSPLARSAVDENE